MAITIPSKEYDSKENKLVDKEEISRVTEVVGSESACRLSVIEKLSDCSIWRSQRLRRFYGSPLCVQECWN